VDLHSKLDPARLAADSRLTLLLFLLSLPAHPSWQTAPSATAQIAEVKKLYDEGRWEDVAQAVPESAEQPADLELYRGLALAKLARWDEAERAFEAGRAGNPRDGRFLVELAGIAYRRKEFSKVKIELRQALAISPRDDYSNDFLASIYFLEGNLEAALKYWNRTGKPKLTDLSFDPRPTLHPLILDRVFAFSPGAVWHRDLYLKTCAQLDALDLFPRIRYDLEAQPDGAFNLEVQATERNGWGNTKWEGLVSLLRGLPYQSVYPEFYNLDREGVNWRSFVRWDDEKRRIFTEIAAPLRKNPKWRFRVDFDRRNENWDLTSTLLPSLSSPASVNMEKAAAGASFQFIPNGNWQWNAGAEYSYREFRNLRGIPAKAAPFFTNGSAIALHLSVQRSLVRFPERRFTLNSGATGEIGTFFEDPLGRYARVEGFLESNWLPQARGDDYQMQASLRGEGTFGKVPLDGLFMLGFERDNSLWLRGHPGLRDGEKGNAPLGRNYVLANWGLDKIIHKDSLFTVKMGPLLDTGRIYDPSGLFGSPKWLWDTGLQLKVRVLGSFEFVLGYGKDLRSGNNSFFSTVSR